MKMEHWIEHNDQHYKEYKEFALQLEEAGQKQAASYVRDMAELTNESSEYLKKAINQLNQ